MPNEADHNRRHTSVLNNAYDAVTAVAIGQVVKGDKTDRDKMAAGSTRAPSLTSSN